MRFSLVYKSRSNFVFRRFVLLPVFFDFRFPQRDGGDGTSGSLARWVIDGNFVKKRGFRGEQLADFGRILLRLGRLDVSKSSVARLELHTIVYRWLPVECWSLR